jgi:hypothetical protein
MTRVFVAILVWTVVVLTVLFLVALAFEDAAMFRQLLGALVACVGFAARGVSPLGQGFRPGP